MAASFLARCVTSNTIRSLAGAYRRAVNVSCKRYLLSQAYSCTEAWKKSLTDPIFSHVSLSEFSIQMRDQYEKHKLISAVDMEICANKLQEMDVDDADFIEELIMKFRRSPAANPVRDSIVYVIIRMYMEHNFADRLIPLMKKRAVTGLFPDPYSFSLLMDHFILKEDFHHASQVAYEMMLQEDLSHPTSRLLALYSCVKFLKQTTMDDLTPTEIKDEEGEEEWIPVKYIQYPSYDDHFDIKSEQYLLGKTLYFLGKEYTDTTLGHSLKAVGLGLYHKFKRCLQVLKDVAESGDASITADTLSYVEASLDKAQVRDPNKPEKDTGLLTIDDEIYKLLPTKEEKDDFWQQLQQLKQMLTDKGKVVSVTFTSLAEELVQSQLSQHEPSDIEIQVRRFDEWQEERAKLLEEQMFMLQRNEKMDEINKKLKELQEKEETLRFFELQNEIRLIQPKYTPKEKVEDDEETLRAKRIKRRKFRHNI